MNARLDFTINKSFPSNHFWLIYDQMFFFFFYSPPSNEAEVYDYSHTPSGQGKQVKSTRHPNKTCI